MPEEAKLTIQLVGKTGNLDAPRQLPEPQANVLPTPTPQSPLAPPPVYDPNINVEPPSVYPNINVAPPVFDPNVNVSTPQPIYQPPNINVSAPQPQATFLPKDTESRPVPIPTPEPQPPQVVPGPINQIEEYIASLNKEVSRIEQEMTPVVTLTGEVPGISMPDFDDLNSQLDEVVKELDAATQQLNQFQDALNASLPEPIIIPEQAPAIDAFQEGLIDQIADLVQQRRETSDPTEQRVLDQMIAENKSKAQRREEHQARMQMDPEYAKKNSGADGNEAVSLVAMLAGGQKGFLGGIGGSIANLMKQQKQPPIPGAAGGTGMAGMAATAAPILALIDQVKQTITGTIDQVGKFGASVAAIDADGLMQNTNEVIKKFGFVGEVAGAFGDALFGIIGAMDQTASRLAQYSPELAVTEAMIEVRQIMNDMRRANQMGSELADYLEQRQNLRERLEAVMERLAKKLIPLVTQILEHVESMVNVAEGGFTGATLAVESLNQFAQGNLFGLFTTMTDGVNQLVNNTRPDPESDIYNWFGDMTTAGFTSTPTTSGGPATPSPPPGI